ncbi:phosphotransferase [Sphingomonas oligophenolica]|uniref:Phosphotransferase n=1 Tax=Sphingomonas oligophenolica TaxID=301154 RepID=A0ABU9Y8U3_9SPHN
MIPAWLSLRPVVPARWEDVTSEWMTRAIASRHPQSIVSEVRIATRDDGTNRRVRFALTYSRGEGPATVFVKAHNAGHRWVHLRNGNLFNEVRLFASGAALPLEHPLVYCAVPDYPRLDFLLVMEDLASRGCDPRDATRPMRVEQVADGLRGLARLHRHYWGMSGASHRGLRWVKPWRATMGWKVGLARRIPTGIERAGAILSTSLRGVGGDSIVACWTRFVDALGDGAQTLLHGDAHIGNSYVAQDGTTGFLDWQVVRRGHWSQDIGYFLVGALTETDRRDHERELLRFYLDALELPADATPGFDDAWLRYRQGHAYGLAVWLSTLGADGYQAPAISRAMVGRYAAAFSEHDTIGALG